MHAKLSHHNIYYLFAFICIALFCFYICGIYKQYVNVIQCNAIQQGQTSTSMTSNTLMKLQCGSTTYH